MARTHAPQVRVLRTILDALRTEADHYCSAELSDTQMVALALREWTDARRRQREIDPQPQHQRLLAAGG
jgi:hypothetical protein